MLPKWLVVVGYVVATACLFGVFVLPFAVWLLWVLVASITLLVRESGRREIPVATPSGWPLALSHRFG